MLLRGTILGVYNDCEMAPIAKLEIASIQLHQALLLFCEGDFVSSITLAGATDEILGNLLKEHRVENPLLGSLNALEEEVNYIKARLNTWGAPMPRKKIIKMLNYPRDQLKHFGAGPSNAVTLDLPNDATALIDRAVRNYLRLGGSWPDFGGAYDDYCKAKRRGQA